MDQQQLQNIPIWQNNFLYTVGSCIAIFQQSQNDLAYFMCVKQHFSNIQDNYPFTQNVSYFQHDPLGTFIYWVQIPNNTKGQKQGFYDDVYTPPSYEQDAISCKILKQQQKIDTYNKKQQNTSQLTAKETALLKKCSLKVKSYILKKIENLHYYSGSEYEKQRQWCDHVLDLPFDLFKNNKVDLMKLKNSLDDCVIGQELAKKQCLMFLAKKISNPNCNGQTLALCGPPGTGKTRLINQGIAKSLGLPFFQINCGGMNDVNNLIGHHHTYLGSKPGKIVEILQQAKVCNPIIYIDELDKVSVQKSQEIFGALTHIFDKQQNNKFQDQYIGVDINLSKVFFVVSFNDASKIDPILLDRLTIVDVEPPSSKQRLVIAKSMCLEIQQEIQLFHQLSDSQLKVIIDRSKNEAGVRSLRKHLEQIYLTLNLQMQLGEQKDLDIQKILDQSCPKQDLACMSMYS